MPALVEKTKAAYFSAMVSDAMEVVRRKVKRGNYRASIDVLEMFGVKPRGTGMTFNQNMINHPGFNGGESFEATIRRRELESAASKEIPTADAEFIDSGS